MFLDKIIFPYDYIILTIILIIIIICFLKGFIRSVLSLLTWIGSILITIYTYETFANFLTKQILNIKLLQNYEYLTNISSIIISIPIIFLISLFMLKRIRKFLSSDLDKQILGIIFDKFFGIIYGIIFSYVIITAGIIILNKFEFILINQWLNNNSYIVLKIDDFNNKYIYIIEKVEETKIN